MKTGASTYARGLYAAGIVAGKWAIAAVFLVMAWEATRSLSGAPNDSLPRTDEVLRAALELAQSSDWRHAWLGTLRRALGGTGLALVIAVPIGVAASALRILRGPTSAAIDFLRSIPATTLYPIAYSLVGVGDASKIALVCFSCSTVLAFQTMAGLQQTSQLREAVARGYGMNSLTYNFLVRSREALPALLVGVRVSTGLALIVATLAEMFMGADFGMGQSLMDAWSTGNRPRMFAVVLLVGMTGLILNQSLQATESAVGVWRK